MKQKIRIATVAVIMLAGAATAAIVSNYGTVEGTADVKEPVFYLNSDGDLNLNDPGEGYFYSDTDETFSYTFDSNRDFYNRSANVSIDLESGGIDFVEFDYDNDGTFSECQQDSGYYVCNYSGSYTTDGYSLLVGVDETGSGDMEISLGESSKVEFTQPEVITE